MSGATSNVGQPGGGRKGADPELMALPEPRRPWRRVTLVALVATAGLSLALLIQLIPLLTYAAVGGAPQDLGELSGFTPQESQHNTWVRGSARLTDTGLGYRRPLDGDSFRTATVDGNESLWVEVRVPGDLDASRFIPPATFVGRLLRVRDAGPQYTGLRDALSDSSHDAWLLVDGQSPSATRWVIGLALLLLGFIVFAVTACLRIIGPAVSKSRSE